MLRKRRIPAPRNCPKPPEISQDLSRTAASAKSLTGKAIAPHSAQSFLRSQTLVFPQNGRILLKNSYTARWGQIWENKIPHYSNFDGVTRRNQPVGERFSTFQKFAVAAKSFSTEWAGSGPSPHVA